MNTVVAILIVLCVVVPIGRAVAHRISAGAEAPRLSPSNESTEEVGQLRVEVANLQDRVAELAENHEFMTRLLEARPSGPTSANTEDTD